MQFRIIRRIIILHCFFTCGLVGCCATAGTPQSCRKESAQLLLQKIDSKTTGKYEKCLAILRLSANSDQTDRRKLRSFWITLYRDEMRVPYDRRWAFVEAVKSSLTIGGDLGTLDNTLEAMGLNDIARERGGLTGWIPVRVEPGTTIVELRPKAFQDGITVYISISGVFSPSEVAGLGGAVPAVYWGHRFSLSALSATRILTNY